MVRRDQGVRHRADPLRPPPRRLRVGRHADRPRDVGGVAVPGLHQPVVVPRREEHHLFRLRRLDHAPRVRADSGAACQHAEIQGLQVGERVVRSFDEERRLPRLDLVPVVQRGDLELAPVHAAQLEDGDRLVDAAQERVRLAEHLHRHARPVPVLEEQIARAHEVLVGVVALPHPLDGEVKDGRIEARLPGHRRDQYPSQRAAGQPNVATTVSPPVRASRRATLSSRPQRTRAGSAEPGTISRRQTTSASIASALSRPVRGGSGRSSETSNSNRSRPRANLTRLPGASGTRSTARTLLAVSPRTRLSRTSTRRGGTTASASKYTAGFTTVTSSLARVWPPTNSRSKAISTQRARCWPAQSAPNGYSRVAAPQATRAQRR